MNIRWNVLIAITLMTPTLSYGGQVPNRLDVLIQNVQESESLYLNIRAFFSKDYIVTAHGRSVLPDTQILTESLSCQHISLGNLFRIDVKGNSSTSSETTSRDKIHAFDGDKTRVIMQNTVGNIQQNRLQDSMYFRPHTLAYSVLDPIEPLSIKLQGDDAYASYAGKPPRVAGFVASYIGVETIDGLHCEGVQFTRGEGASSLWTKLWLAVDRNYIPVRCEIYEARDSRDKPKCLGEVLKLNEIATGVWVPQHVVITAYDRNLLRQSGEQNANWIRTIKVERVEMITSIDRNVFTDIDFPIGAAVYEVDTEGRVLKNWREGEINASVINAPAWSRGEFMLLIVGLSLAITVGVLWRRRSSVRGKR